MIEVVVFTVIRTILLMIAVHASFDGSAAWISIVLFPAYIVLGNIQRMWEETK